MGYEKKKSGLIDGLKTEWALFWDTILGDEEIESTGDGPVIKDPFVNGKLESLSLEQVKAITRALSSDRKKLNQKLESLNKEIELNSVKLDSLKLVGGDFEDPLKRINELSDQGQRFSDQLNEINERLRLARQREDAIKKSRRELE